MRDKFVKFKFDKAASMNEVEQTLRLACLATESLHGPDRVRLEAKFTVNRQKRNCLIDAASEVGKTLALIFGGYVRCEFGDSAVTMERAGAAKA